MTPFEFVTAVMLLILGLGITGLLRALIDVFKARDVVILDWMSITWGVGIFAVQMQFLWGTYELSRLVPVWTALNFIIMIALALLLFAAGVLVLPRDPAGTGRDLAQEFDRDGRWALICLSAYFFLAFIANPLLFGAPFFHPLNLLALTLGVVALATCLTPRRKGRMVGTVVFLMLVLPAIVLFSPPSYGGE